VGAAGQFLEELLGSIQIKRSQVFIANVVKCRPPGNRDPEPQEISTCTSLYLLRQIEVIQPRMIVTLGRFSMGLFLPNARITQVHGKPYQIKEKNRVLVPMYHPAAALHQPSLRSAVVADFALLPKWIAVMKEKMKTRVAAAGSEPSAPVTQVEEPSGPPDESQAPRQLSLF
jgi:DNA polymerase